MKWNRKKKSDQSEVPIISQQLSGKPRSARHFGMIVGSQDFTLFLKTDLCNGRKKNLQPVRANWFILFKMSLSLAPRVFEFEPTWIRIRFAFWIQILSKTCGSNKTNIPFLKALRTVNFFGCRTWIQIRDRNIVVHTPFWRHCPFN